MKMASLAIMGLVLAGAVTAWSAQPATVPTSQPAVTVAVLDYEASAPGNKDMGMQIAEILTARLSVEDSFQLVERSALGKVLDEQKLRLVGLADQEQAAKVGKLLGAKLLITGKAFPMDQKLMIVTKVIGVETGLVKGTIRTVEMNKPLSDVIMAVSEDAAALIKKEAVGLLPKGSELEDQLGPILKALGDKPRPTLAVVIPEHHIERAVLRRISDPAVETEIKKALGDCKFKLVDTGRNELSDWAKDMIKGKGGATPSLPQGGDKPWPAALQDADLVVIGEGFSEFAVRTGELVTCTARVEINVIDRKTGKIVLADSRTTRAVDLAEATAGKTALQMAGRQLGVEICRKLVDYQKPEAATTKPAEK